MKPFPRPLIHALYVLIPALVTGQPETFSLADFELRGPVRSCTVITDYGQERFEFDRKGRLEKSLTRYSDKDYDITYYKYRGADLAERRDEVFRDGEFEESESFARFYSRDTLAGQEVVERITSYDQQFREQQTYQLDSVGRLERLVRVHRDGIDETLVEYTAHQGEETASYFLNGQLSKTIRESEKNQGEGLLQLRLVKEYFQGIPQKALEQTRDREGHLLLETRFGHDAERDAFRKEETREYTYNEEGFPATETTSYYRDKAGKPSVYRVVEREFVYQQDGGKPGNWIRKIITPENSFTTRKIEYYAPLPATRSDSLSKNQP